MSVLDVELREVTKHFGDVVAGGFEYPDAGEIYIRGVPMGRTPPYRRDTSMVFQNYALFPHMTVAENIAYGLRERKLDKGTIERRVEEMLRLVELQGFGKRRPRQLSGGQQQRVALARSLVIEPTVLLLDEPLGALDLKLRKHVGITFIYVTHDQDEALTMSDRIAVMNRGRVEQYGSPEEIFERPRTRFVADFMGAENILDAVVVDADSHSALIRVAGVQLAVRESGLKPGQRVALVVRPYRVKLLNGPAPQSALWQATVQERVYKGSSVAYQLQLSTGPQLRAEVLVGIADGHAEPGQTVGVAIDPAHVVVIRD
mgnify:CR=1 FL=1